MAIENLPTASHVLAGGAGAFIALSIACSITRLRRTQARPELDALATRLTVLEDQLPSKASIQAVDTVSTRLTVLEVGAHPAGLVRGELAIGTDVDGRVAGVQSKAEGERRAQALLQQFTERAAGIPCDWSATHFRIRAPEGPFMVVPRADGTTRLEISRPTGPLG